MSGWSQPTVWTSTKVNQFRSYASGSQTRPISASSTSPSRRTRIRRRRRRSPAWSVHRLCSPKMLSSPETLSSAWSRTASPNWCSPIWTATRAATTVAPPEMRSVGPPRLVRSRSTFNVSLSNALSNRVDWTHRETFENFVGRSTCIHVADAFRFELFEPNLSVLLKGRSLPGENSKIRIQEPRFNPPIESRFMMKGPRWKPDVERAHREGSVLNRPIQFLIQFPIQVQIQFKGCTPVSFELLATSGHVNSIGRRSSSRF